MPATVGYADILFARNILDPQGQNPKTRRVVVLTPDAALRAGLPIVAAGITTSLNPVTAAHVLLPFVPDPPNPAGDSRGASRTWLAR